MTQAGRKPPSGTHPVYAGPSGRTGVETTHIGCECGFAFAVTVHRSIHVADNPELVEQFFGGELDRAVCPNCGRDHVPEIPRVFHDPRLPALVLDLPREFRHRELELTADLLRKLDREGADIPAYAKRPAVVYGAQALRDFLEKPEVRNAVSSSDWERQQEALQASVAELERRQAELREMEQALQKQRAELDERLEVVRRDRGQLRALASEMSGGASESSRASESGTLTRYAEGELPPGRPRAEVDRWRAGDHEALALLEDGRVYLLARPGASLPEFVAAIPRIRVQLHELDGLPLVALVASRRAAGSRDESALYWPLDVTAAADRALLQALSKDFALNLDLYDDELRPVGTWHMAAPLAENCALALERADEMVALRSEDEGHVAFKAMSAAFAALGVERLGHADPEIEADSFSRLLTPGAARGAMSVMEHWSAPRLESELLLNHSFPLPFWRAIKRRVTEAVLAFGLVPSPAVERFALETGLAPSRQALLERLVGAFADVSRGNQPNDLDPVQEWSNWRALLAGCAEEEVEVSEATQELVRSAAWRATSLLSSQPDAPGAALRAAAATRELAINDILEQEEELEDDAIVDESVLADESDSDELSEVDDDAYDEPGGILSQTLEVSDEDIIERSSEQNKD